MRLRRFRNIRERRVRRQVEPRDVEGKQAEIVMMHPVAARRTGPAIARATEIGDRLADVADAGVFRVVFRSPVASAPMSYAAQWVQVPPGASGSSHKSAKLRTPSGAPAQASGGEMSAPSGLLSMRLKRLCPHAEEARSAVSKYEVARRRRRTILKSSSTLDKRSPNRLIFASAPAPHTGSCPCAGLRAAARRRGRNPRAGR